MVRTLLLLCVLSQILGCAYIGSKSVLGVDPSGGWVTKYGEYIFVGDGVIVSIPEVVITEHSSAMGPIVPIIPLNQNRGFESKQLELRVTITGFPSAANRGPDAAAIAAYSADEPLALLSRSESVVSETTKNNDEGKLWVQYAFQFSYNVRLEELEQLSLKFSLPMFQAKVPELHLSRRKASDNQFIISPGA